MTDHDPGDAHSNDVEGYRQDVRIAERGRQQDQAVRLTKFLIFFAFLAVMAVVGLIIVVQGTNKNVERLGDSSDEIRTSVGHLEEFVEELEADDPEAEAQEAAINRAVAAVPSIVEILCSPEAFADAAACQQGE